jgi:outer membrane protein assembly factor BamB
MSTTLSTEPILRKPLRVWPGVAIVIAQLLARYVVPLFDPDLMVYGILGGLAGAVAIVLWWLFFSRAAWVERLGAVALMAVALFATSRTVDKSIATGAMGMLFPILAVPTMGYALVAWAVLTRRLPDPIRRATMVATLLVASFGWALVRTGGFTASGHNDLSWRWAQTAEERLLARGDQPAARPAAPAATPTPEQAPAPASDKPAIIPSPRAATPAPKEHPAAPVTEMPPVASATPVAPAGRATARTAGADWPGFRGPDRNGVVTGVQIDTDWSASPPVEVWRRPIGPGWSSFSVKGDLLYTQEQRGDDEVVACYRASNGEPVWKHRDPARFWESNGGAGPRGTPTLSNGRVYALGGTGILNALDAESGSVVWSRNAATDTGAKLPMWGFAGSPLVVGDEVVVAASGTLVAYGAGDGDLRWLGPKGNEGYSSPQLATMDGTPQILQLSGAGLVSVAPDHGKLLWEHPWKGYPIVQPAPTADGDVLIAVRDGSGTRRIAVTHGPNGWTSTERWTSNGLKPYFNDFVVHRGHAYGFDGSILACIGLEDGARKWKGGRYGNGQLVLLADQDLLLVLGEEGGLALVKATPEKFTELARFPALEGKTWNHPVVVGDLLLTRNGEEMAAFRLPLASR